MSNFSCRRVSAPEIPFEEFRQRHSALPWMDGPAWPCSWVALAAPPAAPFVAAYRLRLQLEESLTFRVHVSGDERYVFFIDGARVGRGPARAPQGRWHYETYEVELGTGLHVLGARVHSLGKLAPWAQTSYRHGWLLAPEPEALWQALGTGNAPWEGKILPGYNFVSPRDQMGSLMGSGPMLTLDGAAVDWDVWSLGGPGGEAGWSAVQTLCAGNNGHTLYYRPEVPLLHPTGIPPLRDEPHLRAVVRDVWQGGTQDKLPETFGAPAGLEMAETAEHWAGLLRGQPMEVGPHQKVRVLLDLEEYLCAFPAVQVSGGTGAVVEVGWTEALVDGEGQKGQRDRVAGQMWRGVWDTFLPDGGSGRGFEALWWRCGRLVQLKVETGAEPLRLESLNLEQTGYPLEVSAGWQCSEPAWAGLFQICVRSLQACMHEMYMDCPYYEQLQYIGDTRLQILLTYVLGNDDRLARQMLTAFALAQRNPTGWMPSNHPSGSGQRIATFPLWWVSTLHDFARWRGDKPFVQSLLPAARQVLELWVQNLDASGLAVSPEGWNFVDWVDHLGDASGRYHGALNWQLAYTLRHLSDLEAWCGEAELAARAQRLAESIATACEVFWDAQRGSYADDREHTLFSQHTNCLAMLSGLLPSERVQTIGGSLFQDEALAQCSIYFSHYLFEAAAFCGRTDAIAARLAPWLALPDQGFLTTPERFGQTRSDCHAWGAHPLYHYFASFLGIQPGDWGFERVQIVPQPGTLGWMQGSMGHPGGGHIQVELRQADSHLAGKITLPPGLAGVLRWQEKNLALVPGEQTVLL